jgi:hypothetical protein
MIAEAARRPEGALFVFAPLPCKVKVSGILDSLLLLLLGLVLVVTDD